MKLDLSLPELLTEAEAIARDVQSTFGNLNVDQLNWKPSADKWSVAQCLDHLIAANKEMLSVFDPIIAGTKQSSFLERMPVLPGLMGRLLLNAVSPQGKQKVKAPRASTPSTSKLGSNVLIQFDSIQQEVCRKFRAIEHVQADKIIVTSPFASVVVYNLLDAARIIVAHERRHFEQAQRVMAAEGFPT